MMGAKDIMLKPITSAEARAVVREHHYSGKVVNNSQLHIGVFYMGRLEGAMQFGPSLDKRKCAGLVRGTEWHQFIELNRMAFSERLPRNSESRAMAIAFRILRKQAPQIKWVLSFADGTQCGDGTIYRAAGFLLTGIKVNTQTWVMPNDEVVSRTSMTKAQHLKDTNGAASMAAVKQQGGRPLQGYQFRYIKFLDPTWATRLVPAVIPFDKIPDAARMYRGKMGTRAGPERDSGDHPETGGVDPTPALHLPGGSNGPID